MNYLIEQYRYLGLLLINYYPFRLFLCHTHCKVFVLCGNELHEGGDCKHLAHFHGNHRSSAGKMFVHLN